MSIEHCDVYLITVAIRLYIALIIMVRTCSEYKNLKDLFYLRKNTNEERCREDFDGEK